MIVYEFLSGIDKAANPGLKAPDAEAPVSAQEAWFQLIEKQDIPALQAMLESGFNIDTFDKEGATIAHYALVLKSMTVLKLALKYKADFLINDIWNMSALKLSLFPHYEARYLKEIIKSYNQNNFEKIIQIFDITKAVHSLAKNDINKDKIKLLLKKFKMPVATIEIMIELSIRFNAKENWKLLTGKDKLLRKLEDLPQHTLDKKNTYSQIKDKEIQKI